MSTIEYFFFYFNQIRKKKLIVSQALPYLFQMPLICLFSDLKKGGLIYFFQMPKSKYWHFYG